MRKISNSIGKLEIKIPVDREILEALCDGHMVAWEMVFTDAKLMTFVAVRKAAITEGLEFKIILEDVINE